MDFLEFDWDSSSSSSSNEEEDVLLNILMVTELQKTKPKNTNFIETTVDLWSDQEFIEHFRISRFLMITLATQFQQSDFYSEFGTGYERISPEKTILIFLWYAGHQTSSFRDVADRFNVTISTLHEIICNVSCFISNMSKRVITWPSDEEKILISEDFCEMGFPDVIGCLDGSHIKIDTPAEDPMAYYNRKKFYSIQVQAICDSRKKIRDIFIGYPGSVHDARVFRNSTISDLLPEKCGDKVILADSAYPCKRNILTPYKDNGRLTNAERFYNKTLSHCRVAIEHTFGMLKQRFRQLYHIKLKNINTICHFIRACAVLHNIAVDNDINIENIESEDIVEANLNDEIADEENEDQRDGMNYRNYIAARLHLLR